MDGLTLLPVKSCEGTLRFREFYTIVRSEMKCSNNLKFWMVCEQSVKGDVQFSDFERIYKDFLSCNAPYQVRLRELTVESFKICLELSAPPVQLLRLLRLAQMEAQELNKCNPIDVSFMYCLVINLIRLSHENRDRRSCIAARNVKTTDANSKTILNKASKKLEEVEAQRSIMQGKAKAERS